MTTTRRVFATSVAAASYSRILGANDRIRLGLIGAGGRGNDHVRELTRLKDLNVTIGAVCDVWRVNRERTIDTIAKAFGEKPKGTTDYHELVSWKDVDAV